MNGMCYKMENSEGVGEGRAMEGGEALHAFSV